MCVFSQIALHAITYLLQGVQHFKIPIYITPSRASKSAIKAIEDNGGKVVCKFYNPLALRDCVKGRTDRVAAAPTRREDISEFSCDPVSSIHITIFVLQSGMDDTEIEVLSPLELSSLWETCPSWKSDGNYLLPNWELGRSRSLMCRRKNRPMAMSVFSLARLFPSDLVIRYGCENGMEILSQSVTLKGFEIRSGIQRPMRPCSRD